MRARFCPLSVLSPGFAFWPRRRAGGLCFRMRLRNLVFPGVPPGYVCLAIFPFSSVLRVSPCARRALSPLFRPVGRNRDPAFRLPRSLALRFAGGPRFPRLSVLLRFALSSGRRALGFGPVRFLLRSLGPAHSRWRTFALLACAPAPLPGLRSLNRGSFWQILIKNCLTVAPHSYVPTTNYCQSHILINIRIFYLTRSEPLFIIPPWINLSPNT